MSINSRLIIAALVSNENTGISEKKKYSTINYNIITLRMLLIVI